MEKLLIEFADVSDFVADCWMPAIKCFINNDEEIFFELDLHEGALNNWKMFKKRYPFAKNRKDFFAEFRSAKDRTESMSRRTR